MNHSENCPIKTACSYSFCSLFSNAKVSVISREFSHNWIAFISEEGFLPDIYQVLQRVLCVGEVPECKKNVLIRLLYISEIFHNI